MANDLETQLTKYLTDAHSIEEQALAQLRTAPDLAGDRAIATSFREHLAETEGHEATVRRLLEARDAEPSRLKDTVMKLGGKGFLLFARLQPDTPGKLLAHATSYEALELAGYELLAEVAERTGDDAVAQAARRIGAEERMMLARLEGHVAAADEASLRALGDPDVREKLRDYLEDAHAIEEQAVALFERAPGIVGDGELAATFEEHLAQTREHVELVEARLRDLGGSPSRWKDAALRLGALNWAGFFAAQPDTPGKLAAFAFAFEHLEIGGYEQLHRVAERAGDPETADAVRSILAQERETADALWALLPKAAEASLRVGAANQT